MTLQTCSIQIHPSSKLLQSSAQGCPKLTSLPLRTRRVRPAHGPCTAARLRDVAAHRQRGREGLGHRLGGLLDVRRGSGRRPKEIRRSPEEVPFLGFRVLRPSPQTSRLVFQSEQQVLWCFLLFGVVGRNKVLFLSDESWSLPTRSSRHFSCVASSHVWPT